jgi:hypothetical protein
VNKKILIIHPDGNVNNNPHLFSLVSSLSTDGFLIDILSPKKPYISQESPCDGANMYIADLSHDDFIESAQDVFDISDRKYDLIIGIDQGIRAAAKYSIQFKISYALVSYEILFSDEIGKELKQKEIVACKNISFAVCQDQVRSFLLAEENHLDINKIYQMPLSDVSKGPYPRSNYLREKLKIEGDKKIVLYFGSLGSWCMTEELISSVEQWPEHWVLVIHNRHGLTDQVKRYKKNSRNKRIYFSEEVFDRTDQLENMLTSADAGVAFYKPVFNHRNTGKNVFFIGLSSGKISTYLKYGIPIIVNEIGEMSEYVKEYKLGLVVKDPDEINPAVFDTLNIQTIRTNCSNFFSNKLDFSLYYPSLLSIINSVSSHQGMTVPLSSVDNVLSQKALFNQVLSLLNEYRLKERENDKLRESILKKFFMQFRAFLKIFRKSKQVFRTM